MDIDKFIRTDGYEEIHNPKYNSKTKKGRNQPQTISIFPRVQNRDSRIDFLGKEVDNHYAIDAKDIEKYNDYGITYSPRRNLDAMLASEQSWLSQTWNALVQTVGSEIFLGTLRGFSDLVDLIINRGIGDNDYTNPVSKAFKEGQEYIENDLAPIYTNPDKKWSSWGWYMSNIPSIASSLTLLLPSTGVAKGVSLVGKASKLGKGAGFLSRGAMKGFNKIMKATNNANKAIAIEKNLQRANRFAEFGINAFTSRVLENYQEANQVYSDMLPTAVQELKMMSPEAYNDYIERHKDDFKGIDTSNKEEVAKAIAKQSADETFTDDMKNVIFDMIQLYGLRNMKAFMNGRDIAKVRKWDKLSKKYANLNEHEIAEKLAERSIFRKSLDKASDWLYKGRTAFAAELSEGLEEGINFIAQEEGMRYGKALLDMDIPQEEFTDRLKNYMLAPGFWESAFWGVIGGVTFNAAGSGLARLKKSIDYNKERKKHFNSETGEDVNSPWFRDDDETEARVNDVKSRIARKNLLDKRLKSIMLQNEDPFNVDPETGKAVKFDTSTAQGRLQQEEAKDRALAEFTHSTLMESMFVGNYNLTKAYLSSDEVKQSFVEAGVLTQEEADKRQKEIKDTAKKLELSYDENMRAIDNAINSLDKETRKKAKYRDIPYQYFQQIAFENMAHEYYAEQYQHNIDKHAAIIAEEESRLSEELAGLGVDPKSAIRAWILTDLLAKTTAQLDDAKKTKKQGRTDNIDSTSITGQAAIRKLESQKAVLEKMLGNALGFDTNTNNTTTNKALALIGMRTAAITSLNPDGKYSLENKTFRFEELDTAITNALDDNFVLEEGAENPLDVINKHLKNTGLTFSSKNELAEANSLAKVLNERIENAFKTDGSIATLDSLSSTLKDSYVYSMHYEIAKNIELSKIAKTADDILLAAHTYHNEMNRMMDGSVNSTNGLRQILLENSLDVFKAIAKKHADDRIEDGLSVKEALVEGITDNNVKKQLQKILDPAHYRMYLDAIKTLNHTKPVNRLLPEFISGALDMVERDDYLNVKNIEELNVRKPEPKKEKKKDKKDKSKTLETIEDKEKDKDKKGEKTTTKKDVISDDEKSKERKPSPEPIEREIDGKEEETKGFDFTKSDTNKSLANPLVRLVIDDETNELTHVGQVSTSKPASAYVKPIVNPDRPNTVELDYMSYLEDEDNSLTDSIFGVSNLFEVRTPITNGGVLVRNPVIEYNKDGEVVNIIPGVIEHPSKSGTVVDTHISSTGEENPDSETGTNPDVEDGAKGLGSDELNELASQIGEEYTLKYLESKTNGEEFDKDSFEASIKEQYKTTLTPEDLEMVIGYAREVFNENVGELNDDEEGSSDILDYVAYSIKADNAFTEDESLYTQLMSKVNDAFDNILNNYKKRAVVENIDGKQIISLENLLRYCIQVTNSEPLAYVLYDRFVNKLQYNDNFQLIESYNDIQKKKSTIINNAKKSSEERIKSLSDTNSKARTLDIRSLLRNLDDEETKNKILEVFNTLKPGDKIDYVADSRKKCITFSSKGTSLGSIWIAGRDSTNTRYIKLQNGWKIDIPINNDGTRSNLEQLFIDIMVNPNEKEGYDNFISMLNDLMYTKVSTGYKNGKKQYTKEFKDKAKKAIKELKELLKSQNIDINDYIDLSKEYYSETSLIAELSNLYRHVKTISSQQLQAADVTRDEQESMNKENRINSIKNWFNKMYESYSTIDRLYSDSSLRLSVDTINQGAPIITKEKHLITDEGVIGENHKANIHIAAVSTTQSNILHLSDGSNVPVVGMNPGSTFVTIPRVQGTPALIHAYPVLLSADHIQGDAKKIYENIVDAFITRLNEWSDDVTKSTEDLFYLVKLLCSNKNGHDAFCRGLNISKYGNAIEYFENGRKQFVRFYDTNTRGLAASVIQFPGEPAMSFKLADRRKHVIDKFKEILANNLRLNLEFKYIKKELATVGVGNIESDGKFSVTIPGHDAITFDSYEDFVINNGLIEVTTKSNDGKSNFYKLDEGDYNSDNGNITFRIEEKGSSSPVEESKPNPINNTEDTNAVSNKQIAEDITKIINDKVEGENVQPAIINLLLNDSQLKTLKNSKIIQSILKGNVIFAEAPKNAPNAIAAYYKTPNVIKLFNEWRKMISDGVSGREEAFRHLVHEDIHKYISGLTKKLSKEEKEKYLTEFFAPIKEIFNIFYEAETKDSANALDPFFRYNDTEEAKKKYWTDGEINNTGLEEFLVESITRPKLITRLNSISIDGKSISDKTFGNVKSQNLFQALLSAIAKIFNLKLNKGSLLEKEYKYFKQLADYQNLSNISKSSTTASNVSSNTNVSNDTTNTIKSKETANNEELQTNSQPATNSFIGEVNDDDIPEDDVEFSSKTDAEYSTNSLSEIRDRVVSDFRNNLENLINTGAIEMTCN